MNSPTPQSTPRPPAPAKTLRLASGPLILLTGFLILLALGCSDEPEIRVYTVAKKDSREYRANKKIEKQQILGVIIPNKTNAWFLKLMDAPEKVGASEQDFRKIAQSLSFESDGIPNWELTGGWSEERSPQDMFTYAKLKNLDADVTATVSKLPAQTDDPERWTSSIVANVNRWRGQLSLPPQNWENMEEDIEEVPELSQGPAKAYLVSLTGTKSAGRSMGGPFSGMRAPFASAPRNEGTQGEAPQTDSKDSESTALPSPSTSGGKLSYDTPSEWQEESAGGFRLASFRVGEGEDSASIAVSTANGEVEMFVDMWMNQVGSTGGDSIRKGIIDDADGIEVNGVESQLYRIGGGEGEKQIIVVQIPWTESQSLFVKIVGPASIVDSQEENLKSFLSTLSW